MNFYGGPLKLRHIFYLKLFKLIKFYIPQIINTIEYSLTRSKDFAD